MIDFLRPSTRVYVGKNFEIPAVIVGVVIRGDMGIVYGVEWFDDGCLRSCHLERFQFALEPGVASPGHEATIVKEAE